MRTSTAGASGQVRRWRNLFRLRSDFLVAAARPRGARAIRCAFLRSAFALGAAGALSALLALAPDAAFAQQQTVTLKMQAAWPASLTFYENFLMWADRVGKISGGSIRIDSMPAGQLVPALEVLDAVSQKKLDGAHAWAGFWAGRDRTSILFTGGPGGTFGMDFVDAMGWLHNGGGLELYQEFYRDHLKLDVVPIPVLPAGPNAFGWFKKPIRSLADVKGLKCRLTGTAAEMWTALGGTVVETPGGEIIASAQRGELDCAEWVGGVEDLRLGLHTVWKYHYAPGVHENTAIGELLFNGEVWRSLSDAQREQIRSAANETFLLWWAKWQRQNAEALQEMREQHGVQALPTPPEILRASLKAWDRIAAAEAARNPFFRKVLESQKAYASVVVPAKRFYFPPYGFLADEYWPEPGRAAKGRK